MIAGNALDRLDRVHQGLAVAHQLLRPLLIVPKRRVLDHRVELFQPVPGRVPVHPLFEKLQRFGDRFRVICRLGAHHLTS